MKEFIPGKKCPFKTVCLTGKECQSQLVVDLAVETGDTGNITRAIGHFVDCGKPEAKESLRIAIGRIGAN